MFWMPAETERPSNGPSTGTLPGNCGNRLVNAAMASRASPSMTTGLVDQHPELRQAPERGERAPFERLVGEAKAWKPFEECGDGQLRLEPRKRGAEAEVRATSKRLVAHVLARDVEAVGVRVAVGIAIGGSERDHHGFSATDRAAADLEAAHRNSPALHHRGLEAEDLLDGVRDPRGVVPELLELIRVTKQHPE